MNSISVYTSLYDNTAWVKVQGRGIFNVSHTIKEWIISKLNSGCTRVVVDIADCKSIDSTFMGMLTGLSIRMKRSGLSSLLLVNVSPHNRRLLETLGLDMFIDIEDEFELSNALKWDLLQIDLLDKISTTKDMVDAHKELLATGTNGVKQFENVHKMLEDDLQRQIEKASEKNKKK